MTATYTLPTVEAALTSHLETWLSDFLAMTERDEEIHTIFPDHYDELAAGTIPRPELVTRRNEWPDDLAEKVPMIVLVTGEEKSHRWRGDIRVSTFEMTIGAICGGDGESDIDAGNVSRAYYRAIGQLLDTKPSFGLAGARVASVGNGDPAQQGSFQNLQIAVCQRPVLVEFPAYSRAPDVQPGWQPTPAGQIPPVPGAAVATTGINLQVDVPRGEAE